MHGLSISPLLRTSSVRRQRAIEDPSPVFDLLDGPPCESVVAALLAGVEDSEIGFCLCDEQDRIRYVNPMFRNTFTRHLTGRAVDFTLAVVDTIRRGEGIKLIGVDLDGFVARIRQRRKEPGYRMRFTTDTVDGRWWWVTDRKLDNGWIFIVINEITTLKHEELRLRDAHASALEQAKTDALTGLANRRSGLAQLDHLWAECASAGQTLTVALVDLDLFKSINDRHGHGIGDRVLVHFARHLKLFFGDGGCVSRIGGEEFLLVLPNRDLHAGAVDLRACLAELAPLCFDCGRPELRYSASGGVASSRADDTPQAILHRADMALYSAKAGGRRQVCTSKA